MAAARPAAGPGSSRDFYRDLDPSDEDLDKIAEANELYDAVLTGSVNQDKKTNDAASEKTSTEDGKSTDEKTQSGGNSLKRLAVYIGNFPWWTSDKDLTTMALRLGVRDIKEIKFAENRANGQSRGYAEVVVTSQESLKILLEKIPHCRLDGEPIDCRFASRHNIAVFEEIANQRVPPRVNGSPKETESEEKIPIALSSQESSFPPMPPPFPPLPHPSCFPSSPNPFLIQPPPLFPHMVPSVPPPMPSHLFPPHPPPVSGQQISSLHINPAFFNPAQEGHSSKPYSQQRQTSQNTDADFEELMNRNRTIASSAISKAVSGATAGDLRMAMETLLTAIAIIKQSRVYGDECCRALVTSLKDCLVSIQGDYSYKEKERDRDRGRDRDRDRLRERERDGERYRERNRDDFSGWKGGGTSRRHRERSWSEEREKERSREQERHRDHRDRYR
ncbi:cleavage and polyadenylation specificity factor subunit 7-like [Cololabis saira]|uniref:cleavage and polyadenylation specificity factor subunit 7-like n=1 Tax=Cololabis saira TaxID=129043 RepID=UPI002AD56D4A|nr:cleavage and polyadenylation specificity factor subunit 7-like [Cololabis saira]